MPVQAIQALPYILTVVLLAGFIGKAIPPKASGMPYVKERWTPSPSGRRWRAKGRPEGRPSFRTGYWPAG